MTDQNAQKIARRAKKSLWTTGLLTFFFPFVGYLYTGRHRLALIVFLIWLPLLGLTDADDAEDTASGLMGFLMLGTTIENVLAVSRAKQAAEKQQIQQEASDLQVTLLKLMRRRGAMTLADCVMVTESPMDQVKPLLTELERNDLIRSGNRESDGAVVYRVV